VADASPVDHLETARLSGHRVTTDDLDGLVELWADARVAAWLGGVRGEAEVAAFLLWNLDHWDREGFGLWVLRQRSDDTGVGYSALWRREVGGGLEVELGYALRSGAWGRGLATEACTAALDVAFDRLELPRVVAHTPPSNRASLRVMARLGMTYDRDITDAGGRHALYVIARADRAPSSGAAWPRQGQQLG
jgi:RimJ/RimL family protein N-acetyltransferase